MCVVNNKYVVRAAHLINCPVSRGRDISSPAGRVSACFCAPPVIYICNLIYIRLTLCSLFPVSATCDIHHSLLVAMSHTRLFSTLYVVSFLDIYTFVATLSPQVIHLLNFLYFIENLAPYTFVIIQSFLQSIINYNIARSCLKFHLFSPFTQSIHLPCMWTHRVFFSIHILSI